MKYENIQIELVMLENEDILTLSATRGANDIDSTDWNEIFPAGY